MYGNWSFRYSGNWSFPSLWNVDLIADMENIAWDGISNPSDHYNANKENGKPRTTSTLTDTEARNPGVWSKRQTGGVPKKVEASKFVELELPDLKKHKTPTPCRSIHYPPLQSSSHLRNRVSPDRVKNSFQDVWARENDEPYTIPVEKLFAGLFTVPFESKLCHWGFQASLVTLVKIESASSIHLFLATSLDSSCASNNRPLAAIVAADVSAGRGVGASKSLHQCYYYCPA
jgi:hypothetical protein